MIPCGIKTDIVFFFFHLTYNFHDNIYNFTKSHVNRTIFQYYDYNYNGKMTEIVIFPLAESSVQIFTCECDLTPIAEQPILVTQKKNAAGPLRSNSDSGPLRALLCQTFTLPVGYVSCTLQAVVIMYSACQSISKIKLLGLVKSRQNKTALITNQ